MPESSPRSTEFQYWEEPSAQWASRLSALKAQGTDEVHCFIPWGLHESVRGIRDFSKTSKLRLERFLSQAHAAGITVRVTVGFPPRRESLPDWALPLGEISALVPAGIWKWGAQDLALTRIPSLHDDPFFLEFLEFVSDTFALLSLYRFPEGPLVGVHVDWGVYKADQGASLAGSYGNFLQERYPQASLINIRYGATFRDYATATSAQGMRVLLEKRPWLAAYDYKHCRARLLQDRGEALLNLPTAGPLTDLLAFEMPQVRAEKASWAIAVDPTLLESGAESMYPFTPLGFAHAQAGAAFRLWEHLRAKATRGGAKLHLLPTQGDCPAERVTVVAGRFLELQSARLLRAWAEAGARVCFPLGLPQYDENLAGIDWKASSPKPALRGDGLTRRWAMGMGEFVFPESPGAPENDFWDKLRRFDGEPHLGATP
ncbi:beta-galactosidase [bacterium]|nr:beta-galactosidase [bacterium]